MSDETPLFTAQYDQVITVPRTSLMVGQLGQIYGTAVGSYSRWRKEPSMLFEIAIVEIDSLGKPTGRFEVTNMVANDSETAKAKAIAASDIMKTLVNQGSIQIKFRAF